MEDLYIQSVVQITSDKVFLNNKELNINFDGESWLTRIYHSINVVYPKFFKMDNLSKAGFLAAELIMKETLLEPSTEKRDWSVLLFNRSSSLDNDITYQKTIEDSKNYFPSPAIFVYTLSNIVTGEIAIRHKIMGESCSYIQEEFDAKSIYETSVIGLSKKKGISHLLIGWVEYLDKKCDVFLLHVSQEQNDKTICPLNTSQIEKLKFFKQ